MEEQVKEYTQALEYYQKAKQEDPVLLPLNRHQFEALLFVAGSVYNLELDDFLRQTLCGYIHHIENNTNTTTIEDLSKVLFKQVANRITFNIDQELKQKAKEAIDAAKIEADMKRRIAAEGAKKAKKAAKEDPKYLKS